MWARPDGLKSLVPWGLLLVWVERPCGLRFSDLDYVACAGERAFFFAVEAGRREALEKSKGGEEGPTGSGLRGVAQGRKRKHKMIDAKPFCDPRIATRLQAEQNQWLDHRARPQ
jgi:hypothetical protein